MKIITTYIFLTLALSVNVYCQVTKPAIIASAFTQGGAGCKWPDISLANPDKVVLGGYLGRAFQRGVARLNNAPYTLDWILADVSLKYDRIFTNYSGDASGRFLELATLTSPQGKRLPAATLPAVIKSITGYQQADGHFGANFDAAKPMKTLSPEITMLWGNARILVGLVTAAVKLHDEKLLESARRLGDFYVRTGDQLCAPAREAEFRATGNYGDGYSCCYFPAIEGLVMLYKVTNQQSYLRQAERMAEWFRKFDALPIDHSHGNLSTWRSIVELYAVTGKRGYLAEAVAKWENAMANGFIWESGGVGEHWYKSYQISEGCGESDWLRFNLGLWRWTGQTRYLDMAERLLYNQYIGELTSNGGAGMKQFDVDPAGPIAIFGTTSEWEFCCSFHMPLGLYYLRSYLATGSGRDLYINFPLNFDARVRAGKTHWSIAVKSDSAFNRKWEKHVAVECSPGDESPVQPVTVWVRMPSWAAEARIDGTSGPLKVDHGYIAIKRNSKGHFKTVVTFKSGLSVEGRSFTEIKPAKGECSRLKDVALVIGSQLLLETPSHGPGLSNILATIDKQGRLDLLRDSDGGFASVDLPGVNISRTEILHALDSSRKVSLKPWNELTPGGRSSFAYNLLVIPAGEIPPAARRNFASRVKESDMAHYGSNLSKNTDLWPATLPWEFKHKGILIKGGGTGLLEGKGYRDYRFDFDLTLPVEGDGITGWLVRARDENNWMMFQLQSADSQFDSPDFKKQLNSVRIIVCRNGEWKMLGLPISLAKEIRKGENHHYSTECRTGQVKLFVDGQLAYETSDQGLQSGGVGFRINDTHEQGLFENIRLNK